MDHTSKIHPYAGHVKQQYLLADPATSRRGRRCGSCCWSCLACLRSTLRFFAFVFFVYSLLWVVYFSLWLVVSPQYPTFEVENFHVSGLNISSSSSINTSITYEIMVRNPNKAVMIYYDDISLNVEAYGVAIGNGTIPSFHQGHSRSTFLYEDIGSQGGLFDSDTCSIAPLYTEMDIKFYFKAGNSTWVYQCTMRVSCDLHVDLTRSSGSQLTYKRCRVEHSLC